MTPCERFKDKIFDLVDQELEGSIREQVQKHVESCPLCDQFYRGLLSLKNGIRQIKPVEAPDSFQVILQDRIRREMAHKKRFGATSSSHVWIPVLAAAVIVLIALTFIINPFANSSDSYVNIEPRNLEVSDSDLNRVQYVIDDLGSRSMLLNENIHSTALSSIDSLLLDEADSPVLGRIQPVRF